MLSFSHIHTHMHVHGDESWALKRWILNFKFVKRGIPFVCVCVRGIMGRSLVRLEMHISA